MLLDVVGRPALPAGLLERLAQIHPRLGVNWVPHPVRLWSWALTYNWGPEDKQWERVQSGRVRPEDAWDLIAHLPIDCPIDEAVGFAMRYLRPFNADNAKKVVEDAQRGREAADKQILDEALEEILPMVEEAGPEISHGTPRLPVSFVPAQIGEKPKRSRSTRRSRTKK